MTTSPESAAQRQLDGYNTRNIDLFCSAYSKDIVLLDLVSGIVFCIGIEQLREKYSLQFDKCVELRCELSKRIVCGNIVIDEEYVSGLVVGKIVHATAIYEIQNGLICRGWFVRGNE